MEGSMPRSIDREGTEPPNGLAPRAEAAVDPSLGRRLVLDELFDLTLYRSLSNLAAGELRATLNLLIPIEARHYTFWQDFFGLRIQRLDLPRRLKLALILCACRLFGEPAIHLVLEAIEVYGVRKYLKVWSVYGDGPLGATIRTVLEDEFEHEDAIVTGDAERRINPERVRNIFLGLNDGLVEIVGAVSGFFAAFGNPIAVLTAGITVAVAGTLSMAAGAWVATSSETEVRATEIGRRRFVGETVPAEDVGDSPLGSALVIGASYFAGSLVPVLPMLFGATTALPSLLVAGSLIVLVSMVLAFLSGMEVRRRVATNLVIIAAAVGITFAIGFVTKLVWGVSV